VAGSDTAITHVVTGASLSGSSSRSVAVGAGNRVSVKLVTSAAAAVSHHMLSIAIRVDG
jgi:hypothetical protein